MAAGLGFKTFTTGEVLTAADTNGYLMQGILVFASSAARASAVTSPQEGQYSYLKDTNALEYYDGAAWVGAPVGDITAVTAGKGLTGGGSSGDVTVSLGTTAKGDLVAGSGTTTAAVLPVGTNGQTLVADSSTATGLKWATAGGGGKVLQVVSATYSTVVQTGANSYIDSNLTASITPSLSTSKVLVLVMQTGACFASGAATAVSLYVKLMRGATDLTTTSNGQLFIGGASSSLLELGANVNFSYLDSPATTSSTTYKTQMKAGNGGTAQVQPNSSISTIILMEIGA